MIGARFVHMYSYIQVISLVTMFLLRNLHLTLYYESAFSRDSSFPLVSCFFFYTSSSCTTATTFWKLWWTPVPPITRSHCFRHSSKLFSPYQCFYCNWRHTPVSNISVPNILEIRYLRSFIIKASNIVCLRSTILIHTSPYAIIFSKIFCC
jgi:hypothetical protein